MTVDKTLTWFINGWLWTWIFFNIVAITGMLLTDGIEAVNDELSAFNGPHVRMEFILISPAVGAYMWREKRRNRAQNSSQGRVPLPRPLHDLDLETGEEERAPVSAGGPGEQGERKLM